VNYGEHQAQRSAAEIKTLIVTIHLWLILVSKMLFVEKKTQNIKAKQASA